MKQDPFGLKNKLGQTSYARLLFVLVVCAGCVHRTKLTHFTRARPTLHRLLMRHYQLYSDFLIG
jgi:hypothetical protein